MAEEMRGALRQVKRTSSSSSSSPSSGRNLQMQEFVGFFFFLFVKSANISWSTMCLF